jgi:hypothetical protein
MVHGSTMPFQERLQPPGLLEIIAIGDKDVIYVHTVLHRTVRMRRSYELQEMVEVSIF